MKQYQELLERIATDGEIRDDRTGVGTISVFGGQVKFDLRKRFPLVTIKKTFWKKAFVEMLWFLRGEPNIKFLHEHGVHIWDEWADKDGNLGPVYGVQWRKWEGKQRYTTNINEVPVGDFDTLTHGVWFTYRDKVDQIKNLINNIKKSPRGRRHIVTAWNPAYVDDMGLPPCHRDFQCYVSNDGHLDLMMSQRSWDTVLGAPFNIAQYAMLTHMLAQCTDLKPRHLIINYGDAHIYKNHFEKLEAEVIDNEPIDCPTKLIIKNTTKNIDEFKIEDFDIEGYESHPYVEFPVAV